MTLSLAATQENFQNYPSFRIVLRLNLNKFTSSVRQTSDCLIETRLYFIYHCSNTAMINLAFVIIIFHDFLWQTIKIHAFPGFSWLRHAMKMVRAIN